MTEFFIIIRLMKQILYIRFVCYDERKMPERILWSKYFHNKMFYFIYAQKFIKWQTMETSCHRRTCLFWLWMSGFIIHMLIFCERWNINALYIRPVFNLYHKYINIYFTKVIFFEKSEPREPGITWLIINTIAEM